MTLEGQSKLESGRNDDSKLFFPCGTNATEYADDGNKHKTGATDFEEGNHRRASPQRKKREASKTNSPKTQWQFPQSYPQSNEHHKTPVQTWLEVAATATTWRGKSDRESRKTLRPTSQQYQTPACALSPDGNAGFETSSRTENKRSAIDCFRGRER